MSPLPSELSEAALEAAASIKKVMEEAENVAKQEPDRMKFKPGTVLSKRDN